MDGFIGVLGFLWSLITAVGSAVATIAAAVWTALEDYPQAQVLLVLAGLGLFIWWFADGVRNWRRKCWRCNGKGAFDSKISSRLNRPCKCCDGSPAGGGRHPTIRSRIWGRIRRP